MTRPIRELPTADDHWQEIAATLEGRRPVLFLDFDGSLAPIVDDPAAARMPAVTRRAVERLRDLCQVIVMSGRDADDVRGRVGLAGLVYAGSHGFDVIWPDGHREQRGVEYRDSLAAARVELHQAIADIPGAELEPKRFAIAIHHRRVPPTRVPEVEAAVARVADRFEDLRRTGGKQVLELRPDLDWDKGRALRWLLEAADPHDGEVVAIYLGDDLTDEDAFAAICELGTGCSIVVRGEDDERETRGQYAVTDVAQAGAVLTLLADLLDAHR